MQSRWNDEDARGYVHRFASHGEDFALRLYTCHLIGRDPALVLHGGGNTSLKTRRRDVLGQEIDVLCVKGSGSDLAEVGPEGMPAVRMAPLVALRQLERLEDEAMVDAVRGALLSSRSPNPSVETLLHAFLPHAFVDHTHAEPVLVVTDQADADRHVRAAFGDDVVVLPWIMPGFPLAKAVAAAFERAPGCRGIVLKKHGLFTFGATARESYERTIEFVDRAERYVAKTIGGVPAMLADASGPLGDAERRAFVVDALPVVRGALALPREGVVGPGFDRVLADARIARDLAAFAAHAGAARLCATNPITPDHALRTKGPYLWLSRDDASNPDLCRRAVAEYAANYARYFESHARSFAKEMLAPTPVVVVVEGVGLVAFGGTRKAATIAADIGEQTLRAKARAQALGRYESLTDRELAEMEYWPLERNKLGTVEAPLLGGQIALVTGAAGAIGSGIVDALLAAGACVYASDVDAERLATVARRFSAAKGRLVTGVADLTNAAAVAAMFGECTLAFGGVDCVVPNAGIAHESPLETMDETAFRRVLDVNTTATMVVLKEAARVLRAQRTGGSIVLQASKNTFAPGKGFAAYSASKAAALQLARIAALEFAEFGVRVNSINADAVFGDDAVPSKLWQDIGPKRMQARGLDPAGLRDHYRERSLLKTTVLPRHVGEAVVFFAAMRTPTTGAVLPVDGGLPEAFPR